MHQHLQFLGGRSRRAKPVDVDLAGMWPVPDAAGQDAVWLDNGPDGITPIIHQIWDDDVVETTCQARPRPCRAPRAARRAPARPLPRPGCKS